MRKLRLSIDDLAVETFAVSAPPREAGTVRGNQDDAAITGWSWLCGTCNGNTCGATCDGSDTCWNSCGGDNHTLCNNKDCQNQTTTFQPADPAQPIGNA